MKATIIILVICFLFAMVTSQSGRKPDEEVHDPPVLDYTTGEEILRSDGCVIKALFNGKHYYVDDKALRPWVRLRLGKRPLRFVQLFPVEAVGPNGVIRIRTEYRMKFNDTESFLGLRSLYKISETSETISEGAKFTIKRGYGNRVYDLNLVTVLDSYGQSPSIGMKEESTDNRYYLAAFSLGLPTQEALGLHEIQFTFHKP